MIPPLDIASLSRAYDSGTDPAEVAHAILATIKASGERPVWLATVSAPQLATRLAEIKRRRAAGEHLPLYGIPFAVKDNIDIAGFPTTAACPAFAYMPDRSAHVVERLTDAGAIVIGKTNLDQFATGLSGARSPYGTPACVFDARYISGGSSSGSAVAVGAGLVSFSLGTDTAGSGRVPASFNNIVGIKPTKGLLSVRGVVPACHSLDCVSIFAGSIDDAMQVFAVAADYDDEDGFSRPLPKTHPLITTSPTTFRFGVPKHLDFFGDDAAAALFRAAAARLKALGGVEVAIDDTPFLEAAQLLYSGPWVAERLAAIKDFAATNAADIHPVVREIVLGGAKFSAVDAFEGQYRLAELTQKAEHEWRRMDVMLLPTAPTIYTIEAMLADPIRLNSNLGRYTNFVNLMDLSAVAVPAGFRANGLPFGVTLMGRAFEDGKIAALADRLHRALPGASIGATGRELPPAKIVAAPTQSIDIAVIGAHLSGQPLNHQLTERGATLRRTARTATGYSLYALAATPVARPGLVRDGRGDGKIEVEIWSMPLAAVGPFLDEIAPPLGIGSIALDDGTTVKGFLCEAHAATEAADITAHGGWRGYLAARKSQAAQ